VELLEYGAALAEVHREAVLDHDLDEVQRSEATVVAGGRRDHV
jgi:hypothetical protein